MSDHQKNISDEEKHEIAEKIDEFMRELFDLRSDVVDFFTAKEIDMPTAIIAMKTLSLDCTESLMKNHDGEHIDENIDKIIDDKVDMFFQMKTLYEEFEQSKDIH